MRRFSSVLTIALAWLPFYALWVFFVLSYGESVALGEALRSGVFTIGWAAVLAIGVWWLTGRSPWPEGFRGGFYLLHLGVGILYSAAWVLQGYVMESARRGGNPFRMVLESDVAGWQLITGLWIYGFVAGLCYAIRTQRRLQEQERRAARAESSALEARLQALRAQLNPHFLFNALHSLSTLVRVDPQRAEQAIDRLGELLRYTLDEDGEEVLLSEEWAFTLSYLELERVRYGDRLTVSHELGPAALSCLVPPFTLQPLVENAVIHGIAPNPAAGRVEIGAQVVEGRLLLRVSDDGPGATPETMERPQGRGLGGLRQRLDALYGPEAHVAIETRPGGGFAVEVTLPVAVLEAASADGAGPGTDP